MSKNELVKSGNVFSLHISQLMSGIALLTSKVKGLVMKTPKLSMKLQSRARNFQDDKRCDFKLLNHTK